jgi:hypothetical protein
MLRGFNIPTSKQSIKDTTLTSFSGPEKVQPEDWSIEKQMVSQESTPTLRSGLRFDVFEPSRSLVLPAPPPKMHFKLKWRRLVRRLCDSRIKSIDQGEDGNIEAMRS